MSASNGRKLKEFSGMREDWKLFKRRYRGYKKIHDGEYEKYDGIPRPSTRDRVTTAYTVADDEEKDPTGASPGDRVATESEPIYRKKDREWLKTDNKWYHVLSSELNAKAAELAEEMESESGVELETVLERYYEEQTNAHAAHKLKAWVNMEKPKDETVDSFSAKWNKDCKDIEANMDWYQIKCCLFLNSLGHKYQGFFDIATSATGKLELQDLMKRAADYRRGEDTGEANNNGVALAAAEKRHEQQPTNTDKDRWPCGNCGHRFHTFNQCFSSGGGLGHLDAQQRKRWINAQKMQREQRRQQHHQQDNVQRERADQSREIRDLKQTTEEQAHLVQTMKRGRAGPVYTGIPELGLG